MGRPHRPGRVPRPALPLRRRAARRAGLCDRPHHRPRHRLGRVPGRAGRPRRPGGDGDDNGDGGAAVVRARVAQGAAPTVGARRRARGAVRRGRTSRGHADPGARDVHRRPRGPVRHRAAGGHAGRRPPHRRGPQAAGAAGAVAGRGGAVEVPALHGGLPRVRRVRRRQRRSADLVARRPGRARRHDRHLLLRPGLLPRRPRLVRQALHVRGVDPDAVRALLPARRRGRAGARPDRHERRHRGDPARGGRRRRAGADAGPVVLG